MANLNLARERSVNHLQTLNAMVLSLAFAVILESLIGILTSDHISTESRHFHLAAFFAFLFTAVPFAHGSNRYLDATYVTGEHTSRDSRILLRDFVLVFLQGLALYSMATLAGDPIAFYSLYLGLLIVDILWVDTTSNRTSGLFKHGPWRWINLCAIVLVLFFSFLSSWPEVIEAWLLCGVAVFRTIADYSLTWSFYFPEDERGA